MIFTFSTKTKRPKDEELVKDIKEQCYKKNINFSGLIIALLREYNNKDKSEGS
jgi:hypothetical protein